LFIQLTKKQAINLSLFIHSETDASKYTSHSLFFAENHSFHTVQWLPNGADQHQLVTGTLNVHTRELPDWRKFAGDLSPNPGGEIPPTAAGGQNAAPQTGPKVGGPTPL
jgi:hypothetical protein